MWKRVFGDRWEIKRKRIIVVEFRDLKKQYQLLKPQIDEAMQQVIDGTHFIMGQEVQQLEKELAEYVGVAECVSCANGTDALQLALMAWGIGPGDAVYVPDFTFFSSGEIVSAVGATPIFVNVNDNTYNISTSNLEEMIIKTLEAGELTPRVIVAVDLFGLPADYGQIRSIANKYQMRVLEDGAQGFGGCYNGKRACSFGDIGTTSFFPAKPLGCYGDGGAIFTDDKQLADVMRSYRVHGKGNNKYDNVRIGMNSRLDTLQAAILRVKLKNFNECELDNAQKVAEWYDRQLNQYVKIPTRPKGYVSSFAQYTVRFQTKKERDRVYEALQQENIPVAIYYSKPMHLQVAFRNVLKYQQNNFQTEKICDTVMSLPFHPYMQQEEVTEVCDVIKRTIGR